MIYSLTGTVIEIKENKIILNYNNLAFELACPQAASFSQGQEIKLFTYLHWNQEQGPSLFGFKELLDKDLFLMIIDCPGIGPKLGITILENLSSHNFLQIVTQEDLKALNAVKGLGSKKAEQLILHTKNKVKKILDHHPITQTNTVIAAWSDLQETLSSLNYSPIEIKQVTTSLKQEFANQQPPLDILLRKALSFLTKK